MKPATNYLKLTGLAALLCSSLAWAVPQQLPPLSVPVPPMAVDIAMSEDGSVVIYEPSFQYGAERMPYVRSVGSLGSADGICLRFGYGEAISVVYRQKNVRGVILHADGRFDRTLNASHVISEVVCAPVLLAD